MNMSKNNLIGGRLRLYSTEWQKLTSDVSILEAISGFKLHFEDGPPPMQKRLPAPYKSKDSEKLAVEIKIEKLLEKDVIAYSEY